MDRRSQLAPGVRLVARFGRDKSGTVAVMGAAFTLAAIGVTAVVADWGSLYLARRDQQSTTDLAALVAARNLDKAGTAANAVVTGNGVTPSSTVTVTLGSYRADRSLDTAQRFVAGGSPTNAVRVTVPSEAPLFFGRVLVGSDTMPVVTTATAATTDLAAFSIGSRLASLQNGVLNNMLGGLLGGNVSLSVMDYNALATAQVSVFPFLDALSTRAGITAGTYTDLATSTVSVGDILGAMADAGMTGSSASTAAVALTTLATQSNATTAYLPAGKLIDLGPYAGLAAGEGSGLAARIRALPLLSAAAVAANGTNQVALSFGTSIPGLLSLSGTVDVGERPQSSAWFRVGDDGSTVYTAQTRIRLNAQVAGTGLTGAPVVTVPILADVAAASGRISSIDCGDNPSTDGQVVIMAKPSVADLWIGTPTSGWTDFSTQPTVGAADLVTVAGIATVSASGHVAIANTAETAMNFTWADVQANTIKTVSTTTPVSSLVSSALQNTTLSVQTLGFTLPLVGAAAQSTVASLITPIGPALDPVLITLLDSVGVRVGEADVALNGMRCDGSVLVN